MKESVEQILERFRLPYPKQIHLGLTRIQAIMDVLGNPENNFPSIHVAGTNGKGSVTAMFTGVFREIGYKTGLYTSPHLQRFTERIRIDTLDSLNEISEKKFKNILVNKVLPAVEKIPVDSIGEATEFEIMTAVAFYYFNEQKIDIGIIETGLGGRLDATNVLKSPLACIITNIGFDHCERLGNTIKEIAYEKAAIIKPNSIVITACHGTALNVIKKQVQKVNAKDIFVPGNFYLKPIHSNKTGIKVKVSKGTFKNQEFEIPLAGNHQLQNLGIVIKTLEQTLPLIEIKRNDIALIECIRKGLKNTYLPGRAELINTPYGLCLLDGAHNEDGAKCLSNLLKKQFSDCTIIMLVAVSNDKNYKKMMDDFMQNSNHFIFTQASVSKALEADILNNYVKEKGKNGISIIDYKTALKTGLNMLKEFRERQQTLLCVCGSLYLVGETREILKNGM